jgi:hypothetical protein
VSPAVHPPLLNDGVAKWFSQRPKPFTNCMFAAVCVPLSFMGYDLPNDFVRQLRVASGVDENKATSTAATRKALKVLIPDCPIQFGALDETRMLERIAAGEIVVRVVVRVADLPHELSQHFKPSFKGRHAVTLVAAKPVPPDDFEVLWFDPMGRPLDTYPGIRILYSKFKDALSRNADGKVQVTFGEKNAALDEDRDDDDDHNDPGIFAGNPLIAPVPDGPVVLTRGRPNRFVTVPAGTPLLHPVTLEVVTRTADAANLRFAGRSTDRKFAGVWVNTRRIPRARGKTLLLVNRQLIGKSFVNP